MVQGPHTPSIAVTIGHQTRIYLAFVTTALIDLDAPATVTLHAATFSDIAGFTAEPLTHDNTYRRASARLILVDAVELAWHVPAAAATSICSCRRIQCSWVSTRCSSGCGNGPSPSSQSRCGVTRRRRPALA
jgi:hypothetical protein